MSLATSNFLVPNGTFIVVLIAFIIVLRVITKYVLPPLNAESAQRGRCQALEARHNSQALLLNPGSRK